MFGLLYERLIIKTLYKGLSHNCQGLATYQTSPQSTDGMKLAAAVAVSTMRMVIAESGAAAVELQWSEVSEQH